MKQLALAVTGLLISTAVSALGGTVDSINYTERAIVIDDRFYRLSDTLEVIDASGRPAVLFSVKKGSFVSGTVAGGKMAGGKRPAQKTIETLTILPAAPLDDDDNEGRGNTDR